MSAPAVIAELSAEAVTAKKSKVRYGAGKMAELSLAAQALGPDRMGDFLAKNSH